MEEAFRLNLLEIFKTRAKNSSPNVLNLFVVLADLDMVIDTSRAITRRRKLKALSLQA